MTLRTGITDASITGLEVHTGSTENAGPENEGPMRDHLDQREIDTTGK